MPRIRSAELAYGNVTSHVRPSQEEIKARRLCSVHSARLERDGHCWRITAPGIDLRIADLATICPSDFNPRR